MWAWIFILPIPFLMTLNAWFAFLTLISGGDIRKQKSKCTKDVCNEHFREAVSSNFKIQFLNQKEMPAVTNVFEMDDKMVYYQQVLSYIAKMSIIYFRMAQPAECTASRMRKVIIYSRKNKPSVLSLLVFSLADFKLFWQQKISWG